MNLELELTDREAFALFCIVQNWGGHPQGPRSVADKVSLALSTALPGLSRATATSRCFPVAPWFVDDTWESFERRMPSGDLNA